METLESLFFILNRLLHELCSKLISLRWRPMNCGLRLNWKFGKQSGRLGKKKKNSIAMSGNCRCRRKIEVSLRVWFAFELEKTTFSAPVRN